MDTTIVENHNAVVILRTDQPAKSLHKLDEHQRQDDDVKRSTRLSRPFDEDISVSEDFTQMAFLEKRLSSTELLEQDGLLQAI